VNTHLSCRQWLNRLNAWLRWGMRALNSGQRSSLHLLVLLLIAVAMKGRGWVLPTYTLSISLDDSTKVAAVPSRTTTDSKQVTRGVRPSVSLLSPARSSSIPRMVMLEQLPALFQSPVPHTIVPTRLRRDVITYTVNAGDNLSIIADKFGLQPNTLIWANPELEETPDLLYIGQRLVILPVDGVYHTVTAGETLEAIAEKYKVGVKNIVNCPYNGFEFEPYQLAPGQTLIVPGGVKSFTPRRIRSVVGTVPDTAARGEGSFVWPVGGYISQGFWEYHRAIDIAGDHGDVVGAADAGYVVYAAWDSNGYGNLVVIDHGNGFVTYYAHLYGFTVDVGQSVHRGQQIGARGSTGRSTGPHLHFEIRYNGEPRNPISFLPGQ